MSGAKLRNLVEMCTKVLARSLEAPPPALPPAADPSPKHSKLKRKPSAPPPLAVLMSSDPLPEAEQVDAVFEGLQQDGGGVVASDLLESLAVLGFDATRDETQRQILEGLPPTLDQSAFADLVQQLWPLRNPEAIRFDDGANGEELPAEAAAAEEEAVATEAAAATQELEAVATEEAVAVAGRKKKKKKEKEPEPKEPQVEPQGLV